MSPTFHSLSIPNYRVYASGAIVSNVGTWMGRVAQDWLVLTVLTDHSATALGLVTGLQFLPFLVLAPFAGMIVDRFPKRRILFLTQTALLVTALMLAVLTATGVVELWHVYALAFLQGVATAVDNPARQTFVSEMVDTEHLPNAVALNSASFNLGRLIGPAAAGLVIAGFGIAPALYANAATFVFVLVALLRLDTKLLTPSPDRSELRPLRGVPRAHRPVRPDRAHHRQRDGPGQRRPGHAWARHGALHGDLHGRHALRSPHDRVDRRRVGSPLDHRHRHHRGGSQPGRGGPLVRTSAECRGDHPDPAAPPPAHPARIGGPDDP